MSHLYCIVFLQYICTCYQFSLLAIKSEVFYFEYRKSCFILIVTVLDGEKNLLFHSLTVRKLLHLCLTLFLHKMLK
jgi:hypothetical protein